MKDSTLVAGAPGGMTMASVGEGGRKCAKVVDGGIVEDVVNCVTCRALWAATNCFVLYVNATVKTFASENGWMRYDFELVCVDATW